MSTIEPDDEEDKPLDPVLEKVRRKMIRLLIVSGSVMFVSLMAVFGAVVYKVANTGTPESAAPAAGAPAVPSGQPLALRAALPAGFAVRDVSLSGAQVLFYGELPGGEARAYILDLATGRMAAEIAIGE